MTAVHSIRVVAVVSLPNHALLLCLRTTPNDGMMLFGNISKGETPNSGVKNSDDLVT
jgi:hypothetical protein